METDLNPASVLNDGVRSVFSALDLAAFNLLSITYQIFFTVASADLFSNDLMLGFYRRVELILGVFMIFQLALTILKGIVNPDTFFKNDKGGAGNLIIRVAVSLIIFTILIPINTSGNNEFQEKVNNNGLLFGTLYSLQHRILSNNTIGRLVLGSSSNNNFVSIDLSGDNAMESLDRSSKIFTSTLFKAFYRINLKPLEERPHHSNEVDDAIYNDNRICQDWSSEMLDSYTKVDADIGTISEMSKMSCEADTSIFSDSIFTLIAGKRYYYLAVMPFIPMVVALIFSFLLLSFSIDIAVRAFKLVVLRVIAPIPIISYINPDGSGDNSFNTWTKSIASTYLDLFIRLASIYFAIYLINSMIISGISLPDGVGGLVGIFSTIIIWIGLFVFAKQAPKFIKEALGFKGDSGKLFGGFGDVAAVLSTAGGFASSLGSVGASALGTIGSGIASANASRISDEARGKDSKFIGNRAKHVVAGVLGGISGGLGAAQAGLTAKDHHMAASLDALHKRNANVLNRASSGSTYFGRKASSIHQTLTGEGLAEKTKREIETMEEQKKALDAIAKRVSDQAAKSLWTSGMADKNNDNNFTGFVLEPELDDQGNIIKDSDGKAKTRRVSVSLGDKEFNFRKFAAQMAQAKASGSEFVEVVDNTGHTYVIDYATAELMRDDLKTSNEADYYDRIIIHSDSDFAKQHPDADLASKVAEADALSADTSSGYKQSSGQLGRDILQKKRENKRNEANDRFSGGK